MYNIKYKITDGNEGLISNADLSIYDCNSGQLIKKLKSDANGQLSFGVDISLNSKIIVCVQKEGFIAKQIYYDLYAPQAKQVIGWVRSQTVEIPLDAGNLDLKEIKPYKKYAYKEGNEPGKGDIELDQTYQITKWSIEQCSQVKIEPLFESKANSNPKPLLIKVTAENKKGEMIFKAKFKLYKKDQLIEEKFCDEDGVAIFNISDCRNAEYLIYAEKKGLFCDKSVLVSTLSLNNTDEVPETGAFFKDLKIYMIESDNQARDIIPYKRYFYNPKKVAFDTDPKYIPVKYNFSSEAVAKEISIKSKDLSVVKVKSRIVGGILTIDSKPLNSLSIGLFSNQNKLIQQQKTNQFGHFIFSVPDTLKNYKIKNIEAIADKGKTVNLSNDKGQVLFKSSVDNLGFFEFKVLPTDDVYLPMIALEDDERIFEGKLYKDKQLKAPISNQSVRLEVDGKTISSAKTDNQGAFKLLYPVATTGKTELVVDKPAAPTQQIFLANKNNALVKELKAGKNGDFRFEVLPSDEIKMAMMEIPDDHLSVKIKGKLSSDSVKVQPIKNVQVYLANEKGEVLKESTTNIDGYYEFTGINKNVNVSIGVKTWPQNKAIQNIYVFSESNKKVGKMVKGATGDFTFNILPADEIYLKEIQYEDPWLNIRSNNKITEPILFESGSSAITSEAKTILYKVIDVMKKDKSLQLTINAHTDSRGDAAQNLKLSEARAKSVMNYLVENGVEVSRLQSVGFGETKLLNRCKDGEVCSDQEHALNRRIEFEIKKVK